MAPAALLGLLLALVLAGAGPGVEALTENGVCCSTKTMDVSKKGVVQGWGCQADAGLAPLQRWVKQPGWGLVDAAKDVWRTPGHADNYLWLAFAGDSELRLEFWLLARHIGEATR
jgi:hypothetical protein